MAEWWFGYFTGGELNYLDSRWLGMLTIFIVIAGFYFADSRRKRIAMRRNSSGLCARCSNALTESRSLVPIAGGGEISRIWRGVVCEPCAATSKRSDRLLWLFLAIAFIATIGLLQWNQRA